MNATKTVTNVISIVLANRAVSREAVDGASPPLDEICLPHRGWRKATMSHMPLSRVE